MRQNLRFRCTLACLLVPVLLFLAPCPVMAADGDGDGIEDAVDNCPDDPNRWQYDIDEDGVGDVCDPETVCDTEYTITDPRDFINLRLVDGCLLIADAEVTVAEDMTAESGGVVTHSLRLLDGLVLNVTGTLEVQSGGYIDLEGKGLQGGNNGSTFGGRGESFDPESDEIVAGAGGGPGAGGSYGGRGARGTGGAGWTNEPYGLLEDPRHLGSGGGGEGAQGIGGNGGGRATITAGSLIVEGTLRASGGSGGGDPWRAGGGGSGGAIVIHAGSFGGTGWIQAHGNVGAQAVSDNPDTYGGSGGGGRVAVYYDEMTFPEENITARGGLGNLPGSAGTIYLKGNTETYGDLIIDNGGGLAGTATFLRTSLDTFRSVTIWHRGRLRVRSEEVTEFSLEDPLELLDNGELILEDGVTLYVPGGDLDVESGAKLTLESGATISTGTLSINLLDGATFTYATGSLIDASVSRAYVQGGSLLTLEPGVTWNAAQLWIDGGTVDSHIDLDYPVGGAFILTGDGTINLLNGSVLSLPYFDATNVQSGTVNIPEGSRLEIPDDTVTIGDGVTWSKSGQFNEADEFGDLTVEAGGKLDTGTPIKVTRDMTVGGTVTHSPRLLEGLVLEVANTLELEEGGLIDLEGKGLRGGNSGSAFGGRGESFDPESDEMVAGAGGGPGAGGSYGGRGARGTGGAGWTNEPYGLLEDPRHLGSGGGGEGAEGIGGNGGGRATITAGSLIVEGTLRASGGSGAGDPWRAGGGGSGGAIVIHAGSFGGTGWIQAQGNVGAQAVWNNPDTYGGSGGGGRVAVYYDEMTFPEENITARGGLGNLPGSAGTIYLKGNTETYGDLIIDNGGGLAGTATFLRTSLDTFRSVTIWHRGRLRVRSEEVTEFSLEDPLELLDNGELILEDGVTLYVPGGDLDVESGAKLTLESGATISAGTLSINLLDGATFTYAMGSLIDAVVSRAYVQGGSLLTLVPGVTWDAGQLWIDGGTVDSHIDLDYPVGGDFILAGGGTINLLNGSVLSLPYFDATNIQSGTVNLTAGNRLAIASESVTVGNGVTLIKDGVFGSPDAISSLTIESGGMVTHSSILLDGLVLDVTGTLEVQSGGSIDLEGKGLRGGNSGSAFGGRGESFDPESDEIVAGAGGGPGAGGSYGGRGARGTGGAGWTNEPYGLLEDSRHLGSGGGGEGAEGIGGNGGGRATITAGSLIVEGTLRASGGSGGGDPWRAGGGGSGGAIVIHAGSFGGTGWIQAHGNVGAQAVWDNPDTYGGSGGGGRVAVYYDEMTFPEENITARGGLGNLPGSAGTIYLEGNTETYGDLIIDNGGGSGWVLTPLLTELQRFRTVRIRSGSRAEIPGPMLEADELSIDSSSVLTHPLEKLGGLHLKIHGQFTIETGGVIGAGGRGLGGGGNGSDCDGCEPGSVGETYDPDDNIVPGSELGAGGSYGDRGGEPLFSTANYPYGEPDDPRHLGSGGSRKGSGQGGRGGGRVWIEAESCQLDGPIMIQGGDASSSGDSARGGGSGGALRLDCATVVFGRDAAQCSLATDGDWQTCHDNRLVCAYGGDGKTGGGGGGGGRVAVPTIEGGVEIPRECIDVTGGQSDGTYPGEQGTVSYLEGCYVSLFLDHVTGPCDDVPPVGLSVQNDECQVAEIQVTIEDIPDWLECADLSCTVTQPLADQGFDCSTSDVGGVCNLSIVSDSAGMIPQSLLAPQEIASITFTGNAACQDDCATQVGLNLTDVLVLAGNQEPASTFFHPGSFAPDPLQPPCPSSITPTPTSTPTDTPTATPTATRTPTNTPTYAPTDTPTGTYTRTPTRTGTPTRSYSRTRTVTRTPTWSYTRTPTRTGTPTRSYTRTPTRTGTPTRSYTRTRTATQTPSETASPACTGDCDGNGAVSISELITGVKIALGNEPMEKCPVFDANDDGECHIGELITAVNNALGECP